VTKKHLCATGTWPDHLTWTLEPSYAGNDEGFKVTVQVVDQAGEAWTATEFPVTVSLALNDQLGFGVGQGFLAGPSPTTLTTTGGIITFNLSIGPTGSPTTGQYSLRAMVLQPTVPGPSNIRSQISVEGVTFSVGIIGVLTGNAAAVKLHSHAKNENFIDQEKLVDHKKRTGHGKTPLQEIQ